MPNNDKILETKKIDKHYNFSIFSRYNSNENISKNLTSTPSIKVTNLNFYKKNTIKNV